MALVPPVTVPDTLPLVFSFAEGRGYDVFFEYAVKNVATSNVIAAGVAAM